jgi:release factor glutamine methyltransferase
MPYEDPVKQLLREKYHGVPSTDYEADLLRLANNEPVEYIIGWTDFLGCRIDLSKRPMVPRYETAFWVEHAIEELKTKPGPLRLADTFSGAGNVGVALLKHLPNATVDFSELDAALAEQIRINILGNNLDINRARIISKSALDGLTGPYDAIFAVPPYVSRDALPDLDPEMIKHEPHLAFFADDNGRAFHKILIEHAWDLLAPGGTLYMETDMDHEEGTRAMLEGTKWSKVEFWPDPYGATPNVVLRK